ncbi:4'-phosphopantetheinyl transferase superfamily protein [Streptomyces sp. NPDC006267]|uniref:4'-phosphopantetheinyl transferase family protein n=1 Tax=unclassified Streptomyces TaxID=2593676 RepID=UPI0033B2F86D
MTREPRVTLGRTDVHLWIASSDGPDGEPSSLREHEPVLSAEERNRADQFYFQHDRAQFVMARSLLRRCLSQYVDIEPSAWEFEFNAFGKPAVHHRLGVDLDFNLSHSRGMCMLGVTRERPIGVDVEKRDARISLPDLIHQVMSEPEIEELRRLPARAWKSRFLDVWVFKEAYAKARGQGISLPLQDISFLFPDGRTPELALKPSLADRPDNWLYDFIKVPADFHAAICIGRRRDEELRLVVREPAQL